MIIYNGLENAIINFNFDKLLLSRIRITNVIEKKS